MILRGDNAAFLVACLVALFLAYMELAPDGRTAVTFLAVAVVTMGLPHGAIDAWYAERRGFTGDGWQGSVVFYLWYTGLAVLTAVVWFLFPVFSLCVFLLISAWHFSGDWRDHLVSLERLAAGITLVSLPALFHPESVQVLYSALTGEPSSTIVVAQSFSAVVFGVFLFLSILYRAPRQPQFLFESSILLVCAWALPPITFFLVYFCGLHSVRHLLRVLKGAGYRVGLSAFLHTLLAVLIAMTAWIIFPAHIEIEQLLLGTVFIGLASLTVPHMLLHDVLAHLHKAENS